MVVVSTRDFRTNQTKYLNLAKAGEDGDTIKTPRDLMVELKGALQEVKEAIAGKRVLQSADNLFDEL